MTVLALVSLMREDPAKAEPIILKILNDPNASQLLAEITASGDDARDLLVVMSTYSDQLRLAWELVLWS